MGEQDCRDGAQHAAPLKCDQQAAISGGHSMGHPLFFVSADSKGVRFSVSPLECALRRMLASAHSKGITLTVAGGARLFNIGVSEAGSQLARLCAR